MVVVKPSISFDISPSSKVVVWTMVAVDVSVSKEILLLDKFGAI